ncbi:MAG: Glycine-rich cell wall protein [Microgenomates group bacterium GW2011_GWF2_45_18]|nr:MAG: Glycine-rich cell wall protein [Microgenomates group bacterium GW2011_GWF1_44_10]KKU01883.1 MAG: Glycine-rich cell wall protein [Microgenomates group bacterium GW2011_GWF2_45_18]
MLDSAPIRSFFTREHLQDENISKVAYALRDYMKRSYDLADRSLGVLSRIQTSGGYKAMLREMIDHPDDQTLGRLSFNQLWVLILTIRYIIPKKVDHDLFGHEIFEEYSIERRLSPDQKLSDLLTQLREAETLIEIAREAHDLSEEELRSPQTEEEKAAVGEQPVAAGDQPRSAGIAIPAMQEKDKKEEEKREKEEEKQNLSLTDILKSDRELRNQVTLVRQSLLARLAISYGITDDQEREKFISDLLPATSNIVLFELSQLTGEDLIRTLTSFDGRQKLYIQCLQRLSLDAHFQLSLKTQLTSLAKNNVEPPKIEDLVKAIIEDETAGKVLQNIDQKKLEKAGWTTQASTAFMEEQLEQLLQKANIPESDIRRIMVRLQTLAISGHTIDTINIKQFERIFEDLLTDEERSRILPFLHTIYDTDWAESFSAYIRLVRNSVARDTHNNAVHSPLPLDQNSLKGLEEDVFLQGYRIVSRGMYIRRDALENQAKLQAEENERERREFSSAQRALKYKMGKILGTQHAWATATEEQRQRFLAYYHGSTSLESAGEFFGKDFDFFYSEPDSFGALPAISGESTAQNREFNEADYELGKKALTTALTFIPGGAGAIPALDQTFKYAELLRKIPIVGEATEDFLLNTVSRLGKLVKILLSLLALIASGLLAMAMGAMKLMSFLGGGGGGGGATSAGVAGGSKVAGAVGGQGAMGGASGLGSVGASIASKSPIFSASSGMAITIPALIAVRIFTANTANQSDIMMLDPTSTLHGQGVASVGCWPVSGTVTQLGEFYTNGDPHAVYTSSIPNISGEYVSGPGSALDIVLGADEPVYAPFSGKALFYAEGNGLDPGYGKHVVLLSDDGLVFIFAHLLNFAGMPENSSMSIQVGDLIGKTDSTGNSTGNHLHYEALGINILEAVPDPDVAINDYVTSSCSPDASQNTEGAQQEEE